MQQIHHADTIHMLPYIPEYDGSNHRTPVYTYSTANHFLTPPPFPQYTIYYTLCQNFMITSKELLISLLCRPYLLDLLWPLNDLNDGSGHWPLRWSCLASVEEQKHCLYAVHLFIFVVVNGGGGGVGTSRITDHWLSKAEPEANFKENHGDPMLELNSPYVHSRFDSNTFTVPWDWATLCQCRPLYVPESTLTLYMPESTLTLYMPESTLTLYMPESTLTLYVPESTLTLNMPESTLSPSQGLWIWPMDSGNPQFGSIAR
jgi:hypothetical protein